MHPATRLPLSNYGSLRTRAVIRHLVGPIAELITKTQIEMSERGSRPGTTAQSLRLGSNRRQILDRTLPHQN
jgi:hypothetical protein